jgi:hypothetical protein
VPLRYSASSLAIANPDSLVERLLESYLRDTGGRVGASEQKSWRMSIPALARDLSDAGLDNVEVILEYQMPLTSKRADVVLAGVHPQTGRASYVVVELKQWSAAHLFEGDPALVEVPGMLGGPKQHPARQVAGYCEYIADFVRALDGDLETVAGVAYLHNATSRDAIRELLDYPVTPHSNLFSGADRSRLHDFLRARLSSGKSGSPAADMLLNSAVAPSKQLMALAAAEVQQREQFTLLGEQQQAVDLVLHYVRKAQEADHKTAVVVTGGPGSGKSVIALSLLGELAREQYKVLHATGSRSFTQTLRQVAGRRAPRVQRLFKYFNSFMDADKNGLDVLILDEAHRLRLTSENRYTRAAQRAGRMQVDELVSAARVPVFLLDQYQVVRPGEMGSVGEITGFAHANGIEVQLVTLPEQYRCGGSAKYVDWVESILGISRTGSRSWDGDERFAVQVVESPGELEALLGTHQEDGDTARMTAGYCWSWSNATADGRLVPDVTIGSWSRPWNSKLDRRLGDIPPAPLWASDPGGFGQVGCVYTAQGFEYDWNGVIIGPDLVWRGDGFVSRRSENKDPDFRSRTRVSDEEFDNLVRNVYKVLLTRGMKGTYLYSPDPETRMALRAHIPFPVGSGGVDSRS